MLFVGAGSRGNVFFAKRGRPMEREASRLAVVFAENLRVRRLFVTAQPHPQTFSPQKIKRQHTVIKI
jgi:hypothetical protein